MSPTQAQVAAGLDVGTSTRPRGVCPSVTGTLVRKVRFALRRAGLSAGVVILVALGGCRDERPPVATNPPPVATDRPSTARVSPTGPAQAPTADLRYSLEPTKRCLVDRGLAVSEVHPADDRLQALRDLAQRNSVQVGTGDDVVGIVFAASRSGAHLLAELLTVPDDNRYRIVTNENVVLVYRQRAEATFRSSTECLRT